MTYRQYLSRMHTGKKVLGLGLALGVVVSHEPPHAHVVAPGEQTEWFGKYEINSNSTQRNVVVKPGTAALDWSGYPPTVSICRTA